MALPAFGEIAFHDELLADGIEREAEWLARTAETGTAAAHVWRSPRALTVPRSYVRHEGWTQACAMAADAGWPVHVRSSGGGLVPLAPGVLSLSLVWRAMPMAPVDPHVIYRDLCGVLSRTLARLGLDAAAQAVDGSFCDGRFNLAVGGRKIAGTAQAWRRIGGQSGLLAHAVIVVSAEPEALTAIANRFEEVAASGHRYRADALTSVARAWCEAHGATTPPGNLDALLLGALTTELAEGHRPRAS